MDNLQNYSEDENNNEKSCEDKEFLLFLTEQHTDEKKWLFRVRYRICEFCLHKSFQHKLEYLQWIYDYETSVNRKLCDYEKNESLLNVN